jgi:hypothetical protein
VGWEVDPHTVFRVDQYTAKLGDAPLAEDHLMVRLSVGEDDRLVDFALIQQTAEWGEWCDVLEVDCKHGSVHAHRYARSTRSRIGDPEQLLKPLRDVDDVQAGYKTATTYIVNNWPRHKEAWKDC